MAVPGLGRADEIGAMAGAVRVFQDNMQRARILEREATEARRQAEERSHQAMVELAGRFETAVGGIVTALSAASAQLQDGRSDDGDRQ